ncbi:MAG: Maf family protein [Fusobacterium perfoetens]|uniref:nucleoside triphosphate pyrophosphatase n=1 Tax=Fusobacterium perfoetens TaxID=852 RepID=UPI0023F29F7C|nr:Maf family protein [Fusobacterium perfoetens]MCI6153263.1 Maf family protein [Fusobacterium perfoetens]MDY3238364.1 Maf family protein [Fusobacterium perfoetens]
MILASNSPRRKEILENFGFNLKIITKNIEEISDKKNITDKIMDIANKKVLVVAKDYPNEYVIGSDTVVVIDNEILGKPKNEIEIYNMLKKLSNREHEVITSFSLVNISKNLSISDFEISKVQFKNISDEDIKWYIGTKEPFDKAGAYGIQGKGSYFVEKIQGDFFSIMGFPIGKFVRTLNKIGISLNDIDKL